jgi:hypothetical protein
MVQDLELVPGVCDVSRVAERAAVGRARRSVDVVMPDRGIPAQAGKGRRTYEKP